jgi:Flp pilus assembly pilin Flp
MKCLFCTIATEEIGQTLSEYALILAFILFAVVGIAAGYKQSVYGVTAQTNSNLSNASEFIH